MEEKAYTYLVSFHWKLEVWFRNRGIDRTLSEKESAAIHAVTNFEVDMSKIYVY